MRFVKIVQFGFRNRLKIVWQMVCWEVKKKLAMLCIELF